MFRDSLVPTGSNILSFNKVEKVLTAELDWWALEKCLRSDSLFGCLSGP